MIEANISEYISQQLEELKFLNAKVKNWYEALNQHPIKIISVKTVIQDMKDWIDSK